MKWCGFYVHSFSKGGGAAVIAKKVSVTVFGTLIEGKLYSGYANGDSINNVGAYILSHNKVFDMVMGIVVAVITLKGSNERRLIVAPEGEIYYEPDILQILGKFKNIKIEKISCLYEKSCGAIIFHKTKQGVKVLLVKNNNGRYWSFPKGHIEKGESEEQTAVREIKEETGLDVEIISGFREISDYCPFGKIRKRVVFFLAQAFTDNVVIQESEIDSFVWVDIQQSRKRCTYENDLRVIDKAELFISQHVK